MYCFEENSCLMMFILATFGFHLTFQGYCKKHSTRRNVDASGTSPSRADDDSSSQIDISYSSSQASSSLPLSPNKGENTAAAGAVVGAAVASTSAMTSAEDSALTPTKLSEKQRNEVRSRK